MRCQSLFVGTVAAALLLGLPAAVGKAAESGDRADDQRAIRAAARQYIAAIDSGNAEAMARFWLPKGDYIDTAGESHPATELIAEAARSAADGQRPTVKLLETNIRFLADDVAIEDGTSEVTRKGAAARTSRGRFSAIWVKKDGQWRLASLRESRIEPAAGPARLADLAWMLGRWSAASGETTLETYARWNVTETFLLRDLKVIRDGQVVFQAAQRIGWDPITHKLKSWTFDSDGGYGAGMLSRQGDSWFIESSSVHPDGRQTSSVAVVKRDGDDSFSWTSSGPRGGDQPASGVELRFTRKTATE